MDRSWITKPLLSEEYRAGVKEFMEYVKATGDDLDFIRCPCNECENALHIYHEWPQIQTCKKATRLLQCKAKGKESSKSGSTIGRGASKSKIVTKIKENEDKIRIIYNDVGQPIGEGKIHLSTYCGITVKILVKVTYPSWHKVPPSVKKNLRSAIQAKFDLDPNSKNYVLAPMARSWRAFKGQLTKRWIYQKEGNLDLLKHPPPKYSRFLKQSVWEEFVKSRLTTNFKNISKEQSERRAKNTFPHRLSRKGYAGLKEELKQRLGEEYIDDRSFSWTKARVNKDGAFVDDETREVAKRVENYTKQKEDGSLLTEGTSDILTLALGTPEHSGRIRGLGLGPTPTSYFKLPKRGIRRQNDVLKSQLEDERKMRQELEIMLKEFQAQGLSQTSEKVGSNTKESANKKYTMSPRSEHGPRGPDSPSYISELKGKKKLSEGMVLEKIVIPNEKIRPKEFSIGALEEIITQIADDNIQPSKNDDCDTQLIEIFKDMVETMDDVSSVRIPLEKGMFGAIEIFCYLSRKVLLDVCSMAWLDVTAIIAYMRFLCHRFPSSRELVILFNPFAISNASTQEIATFVRERLTDAKRTQICFISYNIKSIHWVLIVVDLSTFVVYWVDSLNFKPRGNIKLFFNTGLKSAYIGGKTTINTPTWIFSKCPKQEGGFECGYFVLKFMRDLIEDPSLSLEAKFKKLSEKSTYTNEEIDDVRSEFIKFVANHMNT